MKTLYFEGAGMDFYTDENWKHSDVGNFRIRAAFKNDEGAKFYLEIMNGTVYNKKKEVERYSLVIDYCFEVPTNKDEEIQYNKIFNKNEDHLTVCKLNYTKKDITKWINKTLNCSFDTIEVLSRFHGYYVHAGNGKYNLMDDFKVDHELANKRKKAYDKVVEKYVKIFNRKYPAISIKEMTDKYIIIDNHQGKELLEKYNLQSRYEKVELV